MVSAGFPDKMLHHVEILIEFLSVLGDDLIEDVPKRMARRAPC
jgi:hypothetical protein